MGIKLQWNLFRQSGKWAYGGEAEISGEFEIWDTERLLAEIERNQASVSEGTITNRRYHLIIQETAAQAAEPDYRGFYTHMYPAK